MKEPRIVTLLDVLGNNPTPEQVEQAHAAMVTYSKKFATFGDPRTWDQKDRGIVMDDVLDFEWKSGTARMLWVACFDEWIAGKWNDIPGVVKPL